jgi:hypothetical protein
VLVLSSIGFVILQTFNLAQSYSSIVDLSVIAIKGKQREVVAINSILDEREILESIVGILILWVGKV